MLLMYTHSTLSTKTHSSTHNSSKHQVPTDPPQILNFINTFLDKRFLLPCMQCWLPLQIPSKTELCGWHIILSTRLPISHQGKLCVGMFEMICERFLKQNHLGNEKNCPDFFFSMELFVLDSRDNRLGFSGAFVSISHAVQYLTDAVWL